MMITDETLSFVIFLYAEDEIQWTTAQEVFNLEGTPAQIGFNAGDRIRSVSVPGSQTDATLEFDEMEGNTGERGAWIFRVDEESFAIPGHCDGRYPLSLIHTHAENY